jgi:hypothetical protein
LVALALAVETVETVETGELLARWAATPTQVVEEVLAVQQAQPYQAMATLLGWRQELV